MRGPRHHWTPDDGDPGACGIGIAMGVNTIGGSSRPPWNPVALYGSALSFDYSPTATGVTRTGAMSSVISRGTSPPVITLAGTPAASVTGIVIQVTTTGSQTTAILRWSSLDGAEGSWTTVTAAASLVLGATGITATLAVGTYTCDTTTPTVSHQYVAYPAVTVLDRSANARHLNVSASAPGHVLAKRAGKGRSALRFDGVANILATATWTSEPQPRTVVIVVDRADNSDGLFLFDLLAGTEFAMFTSSGAYWVSGGTQVNTTYGGTLAGPTGLQSYVGADVHVLRIEFNGASTKFYADGVLKATVSGGTNAVNAFQLGARRAALGSFWKGDVLRAYAVNRVLTAAEASRDDAAHRTLYRAGLVIHDGDSLTLGRCTTPALDGTYPVVAAKASATDYQMRNYGVGGQTVATMTANAAANIDPFYDAARPFNIIVLWGGVNDIIGGGRTSAQAYADIVTYANARTAVGWRVIVMTVIAATGTAPQIADLLVLNSLLRANASGGTYTLVDPAGDARFQNFNDTTYYNGDKTHQTNAGAAIIATEYALPAIAARMVA